MRKLVLTMCVALVLAIGVVTVFLVQAHLGVRRERTPLPTLAGIQNLPLPAEDAPVRLTYVNTATQTMPRGAVLDGGADPRPDEPYVMSHPAFVLEWDDGRILLIDAGMSRPAARSFGWPSEKLVGAEPIRPLGSVAEQMGAASSRVGGVVFTHLHTDHVDGVESLCLAGGGPIRVFMTDAQAERPNYTTQPGLDILRRAECVRMERLTGASTLALQGFPGVRVVAAGGHTPGSQIVLAEVGQAGARKRFAFTGDTVNNLDGVLEDVPKPFLYRLLVVPEDEERQRELRVFLHRLRDEWDATLLVSHDQLSLQTSAVAAWSQGG